MRYLSVRFLVAACVGAAAFVFTPAFAERIELPGLRAPAKIVRDAEGIAHIRARNMSDLLYLQGWVHAEDRLFQMDLTRRQPSGTLAELFGPGALAGDVEARTIGLRRAAERSAGALSRKTIRGLEDYARGVNDWVAYGPGLPPEYAALGFTERSDFRPWDVIDSIVIGKAIAFSLSFDLDTGLTLDLQRYVEALGPAGAVAFTQDVFRSQPFDCASTVPDATGAYPFIPLPATVPNPFACPAPGAPTITAGTASKAAPGASSAARAPAAAARSARVASPTADMAALAASAEHKLRRSPFIRERLDADGTIGSNEWGITRALGANGRPIIANDPHLSLNTPSTFYPIGLEAPGFNVFGSSFPGVGYVVLGYNKHVHWGATTNPMDVTDTFVELLVFDATGTPVATIFQGELEPVERIPEAFFFNAGGFLAQAPPGGAIPAETIIVPRRNNGPIIELLQAPAPNATVPALSVQYTGFSATRELDTFRLWNSARNIWQFKFALNFFDFGSQNFIYGDKAGNVAYFASGEMPIRADLQQGFVAPGTVPGLFAPGVPVPPWFVRDGTSGDHEWLPPRDVHPWWRWWRRLVQAVPYEVLDQRELPSTINPPVGWFVNANNDPAGTTLDNDPLNQLRVGGQGIYYLNPGYAGGFRAGTITNRVLDYIGTQGQLTKADLQSIQADVSLLDARFFVPWLVRAFENASGPGKPAQLAALAADPRIEEAIGRLADWDYTTPTGIQAGYDAGDPVVDDWTMLPEPTEAEIERSVAATIYSVWRGQAVRRFVDEPLAGLPRPGSTQAMTSLQHLLRTNGGSGVIDFFAVPGIADRADQRDYKLLSALASALDLLASDAFAGAFANSTEQRDYRWGKLHRIVFDHPFIDAFSIPAQPPGAFPQPVPGLSGIPTDGGFNVVDASSHSARADGLDEFMFGGGPVRRFASEPKSAFRSGAESIWAGGVSGVPFPGNPNYSNLLRFWLVNEALPLTLRTRRVDASVVVEVVPAH